MSPRHSARALILGASLLTACRNAASNGAPGALTFPPSTVGVSGCAGPNQVFSAQQTPVAVPLASLVIGPNSQITAAQGAELLSGTGQDPTAFAPAIPGPS